MYKKNDTISLKFEPKEGYVFCGWQSIPSKSVKFADAEKLETTATIVSDSGSVRIFPKAVLIPDVKSFYPGLEQAGFPQDTTIVIRFNYVEPEIPEGNWYTTIVRFADGSVYQTEPVLR